MYRLAVALCTLLFVLTGASLAAATGVARVRLAANSRGALFQDRLVLEKGMTEVQGGKAYRIEAHGLRLRPEGKDAAARVGMSGQRKVQAAVLSDALRATAAGGTLVALMRPGSALEFVPQQVIGMDATFEMSGCLERRQDRLVLRDVVSGFTEEVRGKRLERNIGKLVEVTAKVVAGVTPIEGAQEVIEIRRMRRISGNCAPPAPVPVRRRLEVSSPRQIESRPAVDDCGGETGLPRSGEVCSKC
jgi:hypothetical protein